MCVYCVLKTFAISRLAADHLGLGFVRLLVGLGLLNLGLRLCR